MLDAMLIEVNKVSALLWEIGVTGIADAHVHLYDADSNEVDGSPFDAVEIGSIPGTYSADSIAATAGTHLASWHADSHSRTESQTVNVVDSLTGKHNVPCLVRNTNTLDGLEGVTVVALSYTDGAYVVTDRDITNAGGYATLSVYDGAYTIVLYRAGWVFDSNNTVLTLSMFDGDSPNVFDVTYVTLPSDLAYTSPTSTVDMTMKLIDQAGTPLRFRTVVVTMLEAATYTEGTNDFILGEDRLTYETDANGELSVPMVPGAVMEVTVSGTRIARRFTVPSSDFDLFDYMSNSDYFDTITEAFPDAEEP